MIGTEEYLWYMHNISVICANHAAENSRLGAGPPEPTVAQRPAPPHRPPWSSWRPGWPARQAAFAFPASVLCLGAGGRPAKSPAGLGPRMKAPPGPVRGAPQGGWPAWLDTHKLSPRREYSVWVLSQDPGGRGCGTDLSFSSSGSSLPSSWHFIREYSSCLGKKSSLQENPSLPPAEPAWGLMLPPDTPLEYSGEGSSEFCPLFPALRRGVALNSVMKTQPSP